MSDSVRPYKRQPTRLPHPWDSPGKNTGVGCHFLLQGIKVKVKLLSHVRFLATAWTAAYQAPPSMGFSRQEHWSGVPLETCKNSAFLGNKGRRLLKDPTSFHLQSIKVQGEKGDWVDQMATASSLSMLTGF